MQNGTATLEDSLAASTKLNTLLSYNLAFVLLGIYPEKLKAYVHTETCTKMFTARLFRTAKNWKQTRCPSMGEWINYGISHYYLLTIMVYYSVIKSNDLFQATKEKKKHGRALSANC